MATHSDTDNRIMATIPRPRAGLFFVYNLVMPFTV